MTKVSSKRLLYCGGTPDTTSRPHPCPIIVLDMFLKCPLHNVFTYNWTFHLVCPIQARISMACRCPRRVQRRYRDRLGVVGASYKGCNQQ